MARSIQNVLDDKQKWILGFAGVVGAGIGRSSVKEGSLAILVYVTGERPPGLPDELEGFPVETIRTSGFTTSAAAGARL